MKNKFQDSLDQIKAEDRLKEDTYIFLQKKVYAKKKKASLKRFAIALASFAIIFFGGMFSYDLYFTEAAYIDIDVNPSIELTLNRYDRIIDVYAYNNDGQKVLDAIDIQHKTYKEVLAILVEQMAEMGYIQDISLFTATLQMTDGENETELLNKLKAYLDSILQDNGESIEEDIFIVDSDTKMHSHEQNLTPAKYLVILELQTYDSSITFDSCRDHSVSDIKQQAHNHMNDGKHRGAESETHDKSNGCENQHRYEQNSRKDHRYN